MVDDERLPSCCRAKTPAERLVRFRTLGCYPLTGAIDSSAASVEEIIDELMACGPPSGKAG